MNTLLLFLFHVANGVCVCVGGGGGGVDVGVCVCTRGEREWVVLPIQVTVIFILSNKIKQRNTV